MSQFVLSLAGVQPVAQALPTHSAPAGQDTVAVAGGHTPTPLQILAAEYWKWVSAGQVTGVLVHAEPFHCSHVLSALHLPSVLHPLLDVTAQRPWGSTTPAPTARHSPSIIPDAFFTLQAWQVPQLVAVAQQMPSTHCPFAH